MARLSKAQAKLHAQACEILQKDVLSSEEKWFVLENWQESATHINTVAGAFFTPVGLARDMSIEVPAGRVIDLCAGIGTLSYMVRMQHEHNGPVDLTCVELNPDYIEVGRKILPEANWICADVYNLPEDIGHFDCAIGNPPFGATPRQGRAPRCPGRNFESHLIDIASDIADYGVFIIPQETAPFSYSGQRNYQSTPSERNTEFEAKTGIVLEPNCGIDTSYYADDWHGVSPRVEIVTADFEEARLRRAAEPEVREFVDAQREEEPELFGMGM